MRVSASVRVKMTVEVVVGSWEAAQPFEMLHKQAVREAHNALVNALTRAQCGNIKIVGEPATMSVLTTEVVS